VLVKLHPAKIASFVMRQERKVEFEKLHFSKIELMLMLRIHKWVQEQKA
jgi:hypothetical protein